MLFLHKSIKRAQGFYKDLKVAWTDKCWTAYGVVADFCLYSTISTLNVIGSASCMVGGAGFACSYIVDEQLSAAYYGQAFAAGTFFINVKFEKWAHSLNYSRPFQETERIDGALTYNLTDYINQQAVVLASMLCCITGVALRLMAHFLEQIQLDKRDKAYYSEKHHIGKHAFPPIDYKTSSCRSACTSLTYTLFSACTLASLIKYSSFVGSTQSITYPAQGAARINTIYYEGPVSSLILPIAYKFEENISASLPGINLKIMLEEQVKGQINATYAGGLFLKSQAQSSPPVELLFIGGSLAYLASGFFGKKERREHIDKQIRVIESRSDFNLIL